MTLKDNIPEYLSEEKYTKEVFDAIEPELNDIKLSITNALLECCISTCSEIGVKRFEEDYSITYNSTLTLDERKAQVINKMLTRKRLTKDELTEFVKRNVNKTQFYITNMAEEYKFRVMLIEDEYKNRLYSALYYARPAHLNFEITLVKYERRCGTFNCGAGAI